MRSVLAFLFAAIMMVSASWAESPDLLQISELTAGTDANGIVYISGIATNRTDKPIQFASIEFNLYDAQGTLVGNTTDVASSIDPRGRWRFHALVTIPFAAYKVSKVTAYPN